MKTITIAPGRQIEIVEECGLRLLAARDQGRTIAFCNEEDEAAHVCRNCYGLGTLTFQISGNGAEPAYVQCACPVCSPAFEEEMVARYLGRSGLQPGEYAWDRDFLRGMTGKERAVAAVEALIDSAPLPAGWLSLYGSYGVGKSGLLKSTVAALCRAGVPAVYRRADDILSEAKAVFAADPKAQDASELAVKIRYAQLPVLAVDEVDRIPTTSWSRAFIFSILDERYNARQRHATLTATNGMPGQLGPHFGYLEDRMKDGQRIIVAGQSLRGRAPAKAYAKLTSSGGVS